MSNIMIAGESPGKLKDSGIDISSVGGTSAKDEFDIASEGVTQLTLSFDVQSGDDIDVWVNGSLKRSGPTNDYEVDDVNDKIIFNYGLHDLDWVKVRRY